MSTAPHPNGSQNNFYSEKTGSAVPKRAQNSVQSASRRNPIPLYNARQSGYVHHNHNIMPGSTKGSSMTFPQLNHTSFSDQYRNFKAMGGF